MTWTLHYEWLFYFSLPFLALVARRTAFHLPFAWLVPGGALILAARDPAWKTYIYIALFGIGMVCASMKKQGCMARLQDGAASLAMIFLLGLVLAGASTAYAVAPVLLLGLVFYLVVSGCHLWGLLTSRAAQRLGKISYALYLLQGPVVTLVFAVAGMKNFAVAGAWQHWAAVSLCAVLLIGAALLAHIFVELPGIALGRSVAAKIPVFYGHWKSRD